jgi:thioredoxin reductase (NADPH)
MLFLDDRGPVDRLPLLDDGGTVAIAVPIVIAMALADGHAYTDRSDANTDLFRGPRRYSADGMRAVLRSGKALLFDVIYPALGCGVRSELASALGAKTNDVGCLEVDSHQRTTVDGIYAAGDVVSDLHQIAVATGHAAIAATHIHKSLPENFKGVDTADPSAA